MTSQINTVFREQRSGEKKNKYNVHYSRPIIIPSGT
jgi:hypothetical protein